MLRELDFRAECFQVLRNVDAFGFWRAIIAYAGNPAFEWEGLRLAMATLEDFEDRPIVDPAEHIPCVECKVDPKRRRISILFKESGRFPRMLRYLDFDEARNLFFHLAATIVELGEKDAVDE